MSVEQIVCFRVNLHLEEKEKWRQAPSVVLRPLKPTPSCGRKFFPGLVRAECLRDSRFKAQRCARILTITPHSMARNWRTVKSCSREYGHLGQLRSYWRS